MLFCLLGGSGEDANWLDCPPQIGDRSLLRVPVAFVKIEVGSRSAMLSLREEVFEVVVDDEAID